MGVEAGFEDRTSPAGAQGYAQIMPATAQSWGVRNPHDPLEAYGAAAKHMATYLRQYGGDWRKALTAYNAGPGAVGGSLPAETRDYIAKILGGGSAQAGSLGGGGAGPSLRVTPGTAPTSTGDPTKLALADLLSKSNPNSFLVKVLRQQGGEQGPMVKGVLDTMSTVKYTPGRAAAARGPAASAPRARGVAHFEGKPVAGWIAPILSYARAHGWTGSVNSGFRSFADQTRIYNSGVRPAAKPGTSNHEGADFPRGAVDVSNAAQLAAILRRSKYRNLLVWAGSKDPVHFSHPHGGSY